MLQLTRCLFAALAAATTAARREFQRRRRRGPVFGAPGVRDPAHPCSMFQPGTPAGDCASDGHYLCGECCEYRGRGAFEE